MKSVLRALLLVVLCQCLLSCGGRWDAAFDRAESMMDVCPDSALALLDSIGAEGVSGEADEARYALLRSQALDKCYIDVTDDSLINVAVDYYSTRPDCRHKMLAYYYLAQVRYHSGDLVGCLYAALKARRLAEKLEDYYYLGMSCNSIYDIYTTTQNVREELRWIDETIEAYAKAQKYNHLNWSYLEKIISLRNAHKNEEAFILLDSLYHNLPDEGYDLLKRKCLQQYVEHYSALATPAARDSLRYFCDQIPAAERKFSLAEYYIRIGEHDSLENEISRMRAIETNQDQLLMLDYYSAWLSWQRGQVEDAFNQMNAVLIKYDTLFHSYHLLGIETRQTDYFKSIAQEEEQKAKTERRNWLLLVTCLLMAALAVGYAAFEHIRRKSIELELKIEIISQLKQQIDEKEKSCQDAHLIIGNLFRRQFDTLEQLCRTYYSMTSRDNEKEKIASQIKSIVANFASDENLAQLAERIDQSYDGVLRRLFMENLTLGQREKSILILSLAGFSNQAAVYLTNISLANYYTIKSRIKRKLEALSSPLRDEILTLLQW